MLNYSLLKYFSPAECFQKSCLLLSYLMYDNKLRVLVLHMILGNLALCICVILGTELRLRKSALSQVNRAVGRRLPMNLCLLAGGDGS